MPTWTALTTLDGRVAAEALAAAMEEIEPAPTGIGTFELEDGSGLWEVGGYFEAAPDEAALMLLAAAFGARPFALSELPETDWVAKVRRELSPVRAGRFVVHGAHDADTIPNDVVPLLVEASMAFGTGHHGTTLGCLLAFDRLLDAGLGPQSTADIGCGTAVLAMAAAKVWPTAAVVASDIDPVAVDVATANAAAAGLDGQIQVIEASGLDHPALAEAQPFGLIFANILKGPLIALAPEIGRALAPGGHVILSGVLTTQAPEIDAAYQAQGLIVQDREEIGEWTTFCLVKP